METVEKILIHSINNFNTCSKDIRKYENVLDKIMERLETEKFNLERENTYNNNTVKDIENKREAQRIEALIEELNNYCIEYDTLSSILDEATQQNVKIKE